MSSDFEFQIPADLLPAATASNAGLIKELGEKIQRLVEQHGDILNTLSPSVIQRMKDLKELQEKLQFLVEQHGIILKTISPKVRQRVKKLKKLQKRHDDVEAKFLEERAQLEAKYMKLFEPLYMKRYDIVNGLTKLEEFSDELDKNIEEKGVPNFWLTAMKTNVKVAKEITRHDEPALKYVKDIQCRRIDEPKGFRLHFYFYPNPYFTNPVLTKTYHTTGHDERILDKAIGTKIEWRLGECLTQKVQKKKSRKGSKNTTSRKRCRSFFNFFNPPQVHKNVDDFDDDVVKKLQKLTEKDYEIGCIIREKIIPHAVSWFTGEAAPRNDVKDTKDEEGDVNEDEGDVNEDDEGEDDEEEK